MSKQKEEKCLTIAFSSFLPYSIFHQKAFLAFVYDELKAYGRESDYEKVQGWMITASVSGIAIALFVGGFVAEISYVYVFIASIISISIAFTIMLSI